MSARMNYKTYPTDYVQQLKRERGIRGRKKARAFMEYWDDMEHGDHNSERFYANSWDTSNRTAHIWIKEFMQEIDLFLSHWTIRNKQHYSYAQKQSKQEVSEVSTSESHNIGNDGNYSIQEVSEVFNINNNKSKAQFFDKNFEDMYFRCRYSNKYTGNKESAYIEYQNHLHVTHNDMAYAYMIHSNDPQTNGKIYNLTNFMKNQAYLNYLNPQIEINKDGAKIIGYYNQSKGTVNTDDNLQYTITKEKFASMVASGEITITSKMKVA